MDFTISPFFTTIFDLTEDIIDTGSFLFRAFFYSISDWLKLYSENWIFGAIDKIASIFNFGGLLTNSFADLIFTPEGIWIIFTVLLTYFLIP